MAGPRPQRALHESILHAHSELKRWRQDGSADRIVFWAARVDELLDRLNEQPTESPPT